MKRAYFLTGTDTGIGKTRAALALLRLFNDQGLKTAALKPIASGACYEQSGLQNHDALQLQSVMSMNFPYECINPFVFEQPVAPHLAAGSQCLTVKRVMLACRPILNSHYDVLFVEGVGGWHVPLNLNETIADLALVFGFPVILVVGLRLGCLNHTLLTWKSIQAHQVPFLGWVANCIDPHMLQVRENIATLTSMMNQPPLGLIAYQASHIKLTACGGLSLKCLSSDISS